MHPGRCGAALLVCIVICTASREVLSQQFNSHSNDEQHPYKGSTHVRGLNQQQRNGAAERKLLDEAAPDPSQASSIQAALSQTRINQLLALELPHSAVL